MSHHSWHRNGEALDITQTQQAVEINDDLVLAGTPAALNKLQSALENPS